jgi:hypothetical protein
MDIGLLKDSKQQQQLIRAFANRSAARLLGNQCILAFADATAALVLSNYHHEKASRRAIAALERLGVKTHVLIDTDIVNLLHGAGRGVCGSVPEEGVEAAFDDANELYRTAVTGGKGSRAALNGALDKYSSIVKCLRGVGSLCSGVLIATKVEDMLSNSVTLCVENARVAIEKASEMAIAAAVVLPSKRAFDLVKEARAALIGTRARLGRTRISNYGDVGVGKEALCQDEHTNKMARLLAQTVLKMSDADQVADFGSKIEVVEPMKTQPRIVGVDEEWVAKMMNYGYKGCCMLPHSMVPAVVSQPPPIEWIRKRLGFSGFYAEESKMSWWWQASLAEVYKERASPYVTISRNALRNIPHQPLKAVKGTVIMVGHVGLDCMADYMNNDGVETSFVGVETCSFNSAASRVLWRACGHFESPADLVMLMYSTTWSAEALRVFKLCASMEFKAEDLTESQRTHLKRWMNATSKPLSSARNIVRQRISNSPDETVAAGCWMMCDEKEREEVARYQLTGDMPAMNSEEHELRYASFLMADADDEIGTSVVPSVLGTVSIRQIADSTGETLMQKITAVLCKRAKALIEMHTSGVIKAIFLNADVRSIANDLSAKNPKSVVWSNLVDYSSFDRFHATASTIAKKDCVHHAYSTNWTQDVFGASPIDLMRIENVEERKKSVMRVLKAGQDIEKGLIKMMCMNRAFKSVLPANPLNTMQRAMQVPTVVEAWLDRFRSEADAVGGATVLQSGFAASLPVSAYGDHTLSFAFTYDPNINLKVKDFRDAVEGA